MQTLLTHLAERDPSFLDRFASRKHGRTRRFIARARGDLYPGRPDLAELHAVEFVNGWWMGTNYSKRSILEIIKLASEVVGLRLGSDLKVKLGQKCRRSNKRLKTDGARSKKESSA